MKTTMTHHFQYERKARIDYIVDTFKGDFGKEVCQYDEKSTDSRKVLTDKGIIIVYGMSSKALVTMYIASVTQAVKLYKTCYNGSRLPNPLMNQITRNKKACENQPK